MGRPSKTRYAVLGMLTRGPMTGYRLREEILGSVGHFWRESFGQLYPTLTQLETEGLIRRTESTEPMGATSEGRRGGKEFELTDQGWAALRAWLSSEAQLLSLERNELLLQLFFGRHAERSVMTGHLRRHRERLEEGLAAYRQIEQLLRADDSPDMAYWLITLRHGIALVEAGLAWNGDATAILDRQRAT